MSQDSGAMLWGVQCRQVSWDSGTVFSEVGGRGSSPGVATRLPDDVAPV